MRKTLIIGLMLLSNSVFGQIPGKTIEGPIVIFDTLTVKKGDIVYLGKGSDPVTGNFTYLYAPKNNSVALTKNIIRRFFPGNNSDDEATPQKNLDNGFAGRQFVIEGFSKISSKKNQNRIVGVISIDGYQYLGDGISYSGVVVDFEPAIRSGEVIKISASVSAPELVEKEARELLFPPFVMTSKGIEPVVVVINNLSRNQLYNKAINWTNLYYTIPNQSTITSVSDVKININEAAKDVKFGTFMGKDLIDDMPCLLTVDFTDNEIRITFTLGGENGDITSENGEVIANISPSRVFNNNGEVHKMSKDIKVNAERVMNDLSYALVDYLMK